MTKELDEYGDVLTPDEIARVLKISPEDALQMIESGVIPGVKLGSYWRVMKTSLMSILYPEKEVKTKLFTAPETIKIGDLVRRQMGRLLIEGRISETELSRLKTSEYSRKVFGLAFPFLKDYYPEQDFSSQRDVKGYPRYWKIVFADKYLITSEWNERNRARFIGWLNEIA